MALELKAKGLRVRAKRQIIAQRLIIASMPNIAIRHIIAPRLIIVSILSILHKVCASKSKRLFVLVAATEL